ncbi:MAG: recombinase family protein [Acetobacter sp.]|nr:recombinase family protein [Acetobacter sp.]
MTIKCAIYTRKSTDEGLDKEFNTLDAQRESGENYVKSQMSQGWELLPTRYDDGGFSGGTLERPALKRLLEDVEKGLINMIVVYKIDRLSRSLIDFAKLMEVLDRNQCSFVSVTQNFNTYDSMGRLMLNVLLSFAQFEREVITERIRDKVAASKKKGMWMGGVVPLGYDIVNKKMVVNEKEAKIVRLIFEQYLIYRSEVGVKDWLNQNDYTTKNKKMFTHINVSKILKNILYTGKIAYKDNVYKGQHQAIISQELFDEVQKIKNTNRAGRLAPSRFKEHALLKGLLECECCQRAMISTVSNKNNNVYEYYTSIRAVKEGYKHCQVGSIPAGIMDNFVLEQIQLIIRSPQILSRLVDEVRLKQPNICDIQVIDKLKNAKDFISRLSNIAQRHLIELLIKKVRVNNDRIKIIYTELAINLMDDKMKEQLFPNNIDAEKNEIIYRVSLHRKRGSVKIFAPEEYKREECNALYATVIQAFSWQERMNKEGLILEELAKQEGLSREFVGKILRLTNLAPDIITAVIDGVYPKTLTLTKVLNSAIPILWREQRLKYGFIK